MNNTNNMRKIVAAFLAVCALSSCLMLNGCETINTLKSKFEQSENTNDDVNKKPGGEDEDASHVHNLIKLAWSAPTCAAEGKRGAFKCSSCGQMFAYSAEKDGLVMIDEQESIAKTEHSIGDSCTVRLKNGVVKASSFTDYEILTECSSCGMGFDLDTKSLAAFTPSTKLLYDDVTKVGSKRETVDGFVSTTYLFPSSTEPGVHNWVYHNSDSGELDANTKVPFTANSDRYIVIFVKNNSNTQVSFKYGAEYYGSYCWSDTVNVDGGAYSSFIL